jgi:hypothetical protein
MPPTPSPLIPKRKPPAVKGDLIPLEQLSAFTSLVHSKRQLIADRQSELFEKMVAIASENLGGPNSLDFYEALDDDRNMQRVLRDVGRKDLLDLEAKYLKADEFWTDIARKKVLSRELRKIRERYEPGHGRRMMRLQRWRAIGLEPLFKQHWRKRAVFGGGTIGKPGGEGWRPLKYLSDQHLMDQIGWTYEQMKEGGYGPQSSGWGRSVNAKMEALLLEKSRRLGYETPEMVSLSRREAIGKVAKGVFKPGITKVAKAVTPLEPVGDAPRVAKFLLRMLTRRPL